MTPHLLDVVGLTKRFGGLTALDSVDLQQGRHELLGIIGPNGSGKSTLVNLISGALKPDRGEVRIDGSVVSGLPQHTVARAAVARTFQAAKLFAGLTVLQNVRNGLLYRSSSPSESFDRARAALARVGFVGDLGQSVERLGLLDQRRVELATRLIAEPKLLLMDEPVGGLNPAEARIMIELIEGLRTICGVFIIEHTMKVITSLADRVAVLVNGRKLIDGPPAAVLRDPDVIANYLGTVDASH